MWMVIFFPHILALETVDVYYKHMTRGDSIIWIDVITCEQRRSPLLVAACIPPNLENVQSLSGGQPCMDSDVSTILSATRVLSWEDGF